MTKWPEESDRLKKDKATLKAMKRRADKARNFPEGTDPCSRHAYIIADLMAKKGGYPMLAEEPYHCAISIMATVALLWEARAKLKALGDGMSEFARHEPVAEGPRQDENE